MSTTPPSVRVRPARSRTVGLAIAAAAAASILAGCSVTPPNGTPIIRAVPPAPGEAAGDAVAPMVVGRDGVIVLFKAGDRIDFDFTVGGTIAHLEGGDEQRALVVDREFMVWTRGGKRASISFDDGRTWRPADKAITGSLDMDWRRNALDEGGDVSEIIVGITASPR